MTDKEKLEKIKELADKMYSRMAYLTSDTRPIRQAMDEYHQFIINEYHKEEPVSEKECMYSKDNYTAEDRKVLCDGCEEECEFNKKEEPINDSFEAEVKKLWEEINTGHSYSIVDSYNIFYGLCMDIADWQKEQQNIIEPIGEPQVKESLISKHDDKTCKENGDSLTQEPVSEDLEKEINEYISILTERRGDFPKLTKLGFRTIARHFANWQKQKDSITVSEYLEEAGKEWLKPQLDKSYANYGEAKMMELTHFDGYAMLDAIEFGANWKEQQMMAKAVDATVHIDAGGYPYIDSTIELYDYDKDIPLAKNGDKVKIIVIRES